jgi:hypothetical protein
LIAERETLRHFATEIVRVEPQPGQDRFIAERPREGLARHVLGVLPVAEAVGGVGVDAPDQGLRLRKRVRASHHPRVS